MHECIAYVSEFIVNKEEVKDQTRTCYHYGVPSKLQGKIYHIDYKEE